MAFDVTTYTSEEELATAIQGVVNTFSSEAELQEALPGATNIFDVLAKGAYFTLIDDPSVVNVSLRIVAKGNFFTVTLETV